MIFKSPNDFLEIDMLPTLQIGTVTVPMEAIIPDTPIPVPVSLKRVAPQYRVVADDMETSTEDYLECLKLIGDAFLRGVEHIRAEYDGIVLMERWLRQESEATNA